MAERESIIKRLTNRKIEQLSNSFPYEKINSGLFQEIQLFGNEYQL